MNRLKKKGRKKLRDKLRKHGEKLPKKHGDWYRLNVYDNHFLVLDTWNNEIYHHKECEPHGTDNLYQVIYVFSGMIGAISNDMVNFWNAHIKN